MSDKPYESWRTTSTHFVEVGRALGEIEHHLRDIRAVGLFDDKTAKAAIGSALSAARRLVKHLDRLAYDDALNQSCHDIEGVR